MFIFKHTHLVEQIQIFVIDFFYFIRFYQHGIANIQSSKVCHFKVKNHFPLGSSPSRKLLKSIYNKK